MTLDPELIPEAKVEQAPQKERIVGTAGAVTRKKVSNEVIVEKVAAAKR
jgi:hypothetical protein